MLKKSSNKFVFSLWLIPAAFTFILGFAFATKWDTTINHALYNPANPFAIIMEAIGWYPAFLPTIFLCALIATEYKQSSQKWFSIASGCAALIAFIGLFYVSSHDFYKRGVLTNQWDFAAAFLLILAAALVLVTFLVAYRCTASVRIKLKFWALCGTVYMLANQAVIYTIKTFWQRTRFDDMMNSGMHALEHFTAWFSPMGNGGSSFPSGHTANAAGILLLILLCDLFPKIKKYDIGVKIFCWVYIASMAISRIIIGRHYLSDTLAASAIMGLLFLALFHNRIYQKYLNKTLDAAQPAAQKEI